MLPERTLSSSVCFQGNIDNSARENGTSGFNMHVKTIELLNQIVKILK